MDAVSAHISPGRESRALQSGHAVSIWLDSYNDIFSDFDPRYFSERNISDDFLDELRKRSREHDLHIGELRILVPTALRKEADEKIIAENIRSYFRKNDQKLCREIRTRNKKGRWLTAGGACMMVTASYISLNKYDHFIMHALFVILEPAGWFLVWSGLDQLFYDSRGKKSEWNFYHKLSGARIVFQSI